MKRLKFSLKPILNGAVVYIGSLLAYIVYMLIGFKGHCRTLGWPGLTEGGVRSCSFYEFMTVSLDTPFWPYTFWHAVTIGAMLWLLLSGFACGVSGFFRNKSRVSEQRHDRVE